MGSLMEKELRKQRHLLVEAGTGVVLFAIWSIARVNLFFGFSPLTINDLKEAAEKFDIDVKFFVIFMLTITVAILLWQLSIRLYIGLSASAEGKGKSRGYAYLVLAAVLLVMDIQIGWHTFVEERILAGEEMSMNLFTSISLEVASLCVLLELLISGIRVKILRKKMKV